VFTARYGLNVAQINMYNRDGECLLRGTDWIFVVQINIYNRDEECLLHGRTESLCGTD